MIKQKTAKKQAEALKRILFMCHKRKMLKNPPALEHWWGNMLTSPIELCSLIELIGDVAYDALSEDDSNG